MTERRGGTPRRAILLRAEMIVHLYTKEEVVCGIVVFSIFVSTGEPSYNSVVFRPR
jgi:hypothetical protein